MTRMPLSSPRSVAIHFEVCLWPFILNRVHGCNSAGTLLSAFFLHVLECRRGGLRREGRRPVPLPSRPAPWGLNGGNSLFAAGSLPICSESESKMTSWQLRQLSALHCKDHQNLRYIWAVDREKSENFGAVTGLNARQSDDFIRGMWQVGIMFNTNGIVESVMMGGPAFASGNICKGDCIVKVNGDFVQGNDLLEKIVGDDVPGTLVTLTLKRGPADLLDVTLKRISTDEVADRRKMFDLFTKLSDRAKQDHDEEARKCVDETLLLWESIMAADAQHDQRIADNVLTMQADCTPMTDELVLLLNKIGRLHGWDEEFAETSGAIESSDGIGLEKRVPTNATRSAPMTFSSPNASQGPAQKNTHGKDIVGYCEFLCTLIEEAISNDVLSVPTGAVSYGFNTRTTVGMLLVGMSIDNMVVGGPAYNCQVKSLSVDVYPSLPPTSLRLTQMSFR
jgi:hypothetical protein